jgi:hypothetical protein
MSSLPAASIGVVRSLTQIVGADHVQAASISILSFNRKTVCKNGELVEGGASIVPKGQAQKCGPLKNL